MIARSAAARERASRRSDSGSRPGSAFACGGLEWDQRSPRGLSYTFFAGTVTKNLMTDRGGQVIAKGDTIFQIEPDEVIVEESEANILERQRRTTLAVIGR